MRAATIYLGFVLLIAGGCNQGPPKPKPTDDPEVKKTVDTEMKIEIPPLPGTGGGASDKKPPDEEPGKSKAAPSGSETSATSEKRPTADEPPRGTSSESQRVANLRDPAKRDAAVAEIQKEGAGAVAGLTHLLDSASPSERADAAFALSVLGKAAAAAETRLKKMAADDASEAARDAARFALDAIAGK